ncbi:hypothetical protein OMCYN_01383 [cyanobiont of Ornithocercus magnificus]|nr:hypothetical protein OMCYN_01383 [cyanobiont of Ornithocercus magnificus]
MIRLMLLSPIFVVLLIIAVSSTAQAGPGLCTGPVCADAISRSAKNHWQLILKLEDQQGHRERVVIDCRQLVVSPRFGLVDRSYAIAIGRRACRLIREVT